MWAIVRSFWSRCRTRRASGAGVWAFYRVVLWAISRSKVWAIPRSKAWVICRSDDAGVLSKLACCVWFGLADEAPGLGRSGLQPAESCTGAIHQGVRGTWFGVMFIERRKEAARDARGEGKGLNRARSSVLAGESVGDLLSAHIDLWVISRGGVSGDKLKAQ